MSVAAFPSIAPSSRSWTPGSMPMKSFNTFSGYEARVLLGPNPIGTSLALGFSNLLEDQLLQITEHHIVAKGSFEIFDLPETVLAGMTNYWKVTPLCFQWRYAGPPSIDWVAPGIGNVSVSLLAVTSANPCNAEAPSQLEEDPSLDPEVLPPPPPNP